MNMPDPQVMANAWMSQLNDPAQWKAWLGENHGAPALPLDKLLGDSGASINQEAMGRLRDDYLSQLGMLWADFMVGKLPDIGDRRFAAPAWQANPLSAYSAASYLLNSKFLLAMVDAVEAPEQKREKIRFGVAQIVDAMSPANFLATNPEAQQKMLETKGESLTKGMSNLLADMQKGYISQSDESAFEVGRNVATAPGAVVYENALFQLIQYTPVTPTVLQRPLLMVPPCINKFYILDLQPENSLVRYAVEQGNTVFLVSWSNPDASLATATWDDYVEQGVVEAIHVAQEISGQDKLNTFGFCVGGTLLGTALAVLQARGEQPAASVSLLTTLLDFSDTGALKVFVDEEQVAEREKKIGAGGMMSGRELASTFSSLRPNDLVWNYVQANYLKGKDPVAFDMLYWNADSTNLPGPMFCWYLRNTYLENSLKTPGKLSISGIPVDLSLIDAPTFIYGSREDHIVPWPSAYASLGLLNPAKPKANRFILGASGHIAGVINPVSKKKRSYWSNPQSVGKRLDADAWMASAKETGGSWWPEWAQFLAEHGGEQVKAPAKPGNRKYRAIEAAPGRYVKVRGD